MQRMGLYIRAEENEYRSDKHENPVDRAANESVEESREND